MDTIAASLALFGKASKIEFFSALFKGKSIFNEDLPPEDDVTKTI